MIDDPGQARALANAILSDVRLYTDGRALSPDSPEVTEARALFRGRVCAPLHDVFETALANPPPKKRPGDSARTNLIGLAFLGLRPPCGCGSSGQATSCN